MNTKIKLLLLFLAFGFSSLQAQSHKFLATGFSVVEKDSRGKWGKWSEVQPSQITIMIDVKKDRIVIYSQEIQLYSILKYNKIEENENDFVYSFSCSDDDGMPFEVSVITRKKQDNRQQLYIKQKNIIIAYNITAYPENTQPKPAK